LRHRGRSECAQFETRGYGSRRGIRLRRRTKRHSDEQRPTDMIPPMYPHPYARSKKLVLRILGDRPAHGNAPATPAFACIYPTFPSVILKSVLHSGAADHSAGGNIEGRVHG